MVHLEDVGCLPREEFTQFLAEIEPTDSVRSVKLYFRSSLYPEFYFVSMSADAGRFQAVLPLPSDETTKVFYYIEAVDNSFQTTRSEELEVPVSGESSCRRGPGAVLYPGASPGLVVGATQLGAPAIPVGFQATGITGFLTATGGVAAAGGSGVAIGVAVGAAAGAATGVGVLVAGGGSDGTSTTSTAPPTGGGGTTSVTTSTAPSSSTTTTAPGGSPSTTSSAPGTTTALPTLTACFESRALGSCKVSFDSCSTPASLITRYEWRMLGPPVAEPPLLESFEYSFEGDPRCQGNKSFNHPVRHTVYDSHGRKASVQQNVTVRPATYRVDEGASTTLSFTSQLAAPPPDGRARGQIVVNGMALPPSDNASASRHELRVSEGTVSIELTLLTGAPPGSYWELDFSSSGNVTAGSLRAERGAVAASGERRIVLRLNGDRGETMRLRLMVR